MTCEDHANECSLTLYILAFSWRYGGKTRQGYVKVASVRAQF
jgi:hypothetical protein